MKERTYYYTDEVNDDFAGTNIQQKKLPDDYCYLPKSKMRKAVAWLLYHVVATPIVFLATKVMSSQKIVGREKIKPYLKTGFFLYGNHTRTAGDAFTPALVAFPKKVYLIADPDAFSIPFLKRVVEDLGGMPVPKTLTQSKNFCRAIETRVERGDVICIYPEAHIWPKYIGIRNFPATSFTYPVRTGKPCFTFTTTYHKRKILGGIKTVVYIDGPFFPNGALSLAEQKTTLREQIYQAMVRDSQRSTYSPNKFIKRD